MLKELKQFILRGNIVDLAVAVIIGLAFAAVVAALVADIFTPLIAAIVGKPDFSALHITINKSEIRYGAFLNALLSFLLTTAAVFYFMVKPINALMQRSRREPTPDPTTRKCPECLSEIPIDARRCAFCTSEVAAVA